MTEQPIEGEVYDYELNAWRGPHGELTPDEIVHATNAPLTERAEPFGIAYEQHDLDPGACTCETEIMRLFNGAPFMWTRVPDRHHPCPIPGHDRPERHRYA